MRRSGAVVLVAVALTACADAFRSHQDVVARAAGQELTVERLANLIGPAKQIPLRREVVDRVAEMWVDYQLLASRIAAGDSLSDSATVERTSWPVVAQLLATRLHDTLIVARARPTPAQVDSAYASNEYRYLFHILVMAQQDTSPPARAAKRRAAAGYLARLRSGLDFRTLARQVSEDGSKDAGGQLGLLARGATVRPFEDAGFALEPGQMSDVVETSFGFHIIWRPNLAEIRDSFAADLEQVMVGQLDSVYLDSLTNRTDIRVRGSAPAIVRRAAEDIRAAKDRSRVLATFRGGRLRERDFAMWLQAFPAQTRAMVGQAPDSTLIEFVKSIARNEMLVNSARAQGVTITAEDRDSLRAGYTRELQSLLEGLALTSESLAADTTERGMARPAVAARHVDAYFQALMTNPNSRRFVEVPAFLADQLREDAAWKIYANGVSRVLERAREVRGPDDAPAGGMGPRMQPLPPGAATPPAVRPAPGGPPVRP